MSSADFLHHSNQSLYHIQLFTSRRHLCRQTVLSAKLFGARQPQQSNMHRQQKKDLQIHASTGTPRLTRQLRANESSLSPPTAPHCNETSTNSSSQTQCSRSLYTLKRSYISLFWASIHGFIPCDCVSTTFTRAKCHCALRHSAKPRRNNSCSLPNARTHTFPKSEHTEVTLQ